MKHMKNRLGKQLIWLIGFAFVLLFISLGLVLPTVILPVAEKNIYSYLKEPLKLVITIKYTTTICLITIMGIRLL